jgi:hypothetical protein
MRNAGLAVAEERPRERADRATRLAGRRPIDCPRVSDESPPETSTEPPPEGTPEGQELPTVDDADDLRGFHFRRYLRMRLTWVLLGLGMVVGAVAGAFAAGVALAVGGAVAMLVLGVLIAFGIADSASEDDFFNVYAAQRGMTRTEDGSLPPVTPLLRKGDERKADEVLRGSLGDGLDGTLALYTYTDVSYDKNGRHETDYHFTISLVDLPECVESVPELYCNRKSGFRFMEGLEDVFRTKQRLHLESEALDEHYEIFVSKRQDQNWIRQLFSPTFIVWLTDLAPGKFAFELDSGVLCCNVNGHKKDAKHLDAMRDAATAVAGRIREEASE